MDLDAKSQISENHLAENDRSLYRISNYLLLGIDIGTESNIYVQWLEAAASGDIAEIRRLIHLGADVGWEDADNMNALHFSAKNGHKEVVQLLLDYGAAVNAIGNHSNTAFHRSVEKGYKEIVQLLPNNGASVDSKDVDSNIPLHLAARSLAAKNAKEEVVNLLLDSDTPLHMAAKNGHKEIVALLLDYRAAVDARDGFSATALHQAAQLGDTEIVQLLLNHGASVDAEDLVYQTSLHRAANRGHKEVATLLLDWCAAVDVRDFVSATALHKAAEEGHKEIVQLLLNHGASVDAKDGGFNTSLHLAAKMGYKKVVALLLEFCAKVDTQNRNLATALHEASVNGHTEIVQLLLNRGASVDSKDVYSNTSLHYASSNGYKLVVDLLINHDADVDARNKDSVTALHYAVELGHNEIVHLLLNHGAKADLKDNNSDTPLHLAVRNADKYITSQLLASGVNIDEKSKDGNTLLAEVSKTGDIEMASLLLKHGADLEAINLDGQTCLIIAVSAADQNMVSLLIERGSHIDVSDNDLLTALHWSAKDGHLTIVELLLQKMANTESRSKEDDTALHIAVKFNRINVVAALIDHNANINAENGDGKSPIEVAISKGHIEIVFQLKDAGARMGDNGQETLWLLYLAAKAGQIPLIKSTLDQVDEEEKKKYMNAILHEASRHGKVDVVTYLLNGSAEIESLNEDGLTPLFLAGQYPDVISTLIHRGACINARSHTPPYQGVLHDYASLDQIEGVILLLNCGYNIHTSDEGDRTALHYVAENGKGHCEIAEILLQQGVDVNAKDMYGDTALHYCSKHNSLDLAILLIKFGIDLDAMSFRHGSTSLHLAIEYENLELISLLVKNRANVNLRDDRETALHLTVQKNLTTECSLLIKSGASVNSRDIEGNTPLARALNNYNPSLVELLLEHGASVDAFCRSKYMVSNIILNLLERGEDYNLFRQCLDAVNLIVKAGADRSGMEEAMYKMEMRYPAMRKLLMEPSFRHLKLKDSMTPSSFIANEKDISVINAYFSAYESENEDENEDDIPLKEFTSDNINVYKVDPLNVKQLVKTEHKYGTGFPRFKLLQFDEVSAFANHGCSSIALEKSPPVLPLKLFEAMSINERAMNITQSLLNCIGARFFASNHYFMLELDTCVDVVPPKWASRFDKMQGIVRETGLLIVQAPPKRSSWSIPAWYKSDNPYFRFIDAVYTSRRSCLRFSQETFSDILGGSEQKLAADLHATLIAGLSILSIAGGDDLVEKLVMAVRGVKPVPIQNVSPPKIVRNDWQVRNRRHCPCGRGSSHRPLSPVAAAKAVGIDIWRERSDDIVNRVWDLQDDTLVKNVDVRKIVFITHRWDTSEISPEIDYQTVMENKNHAISLLSTKLNRIKTALMKKDIRYVWIDTICIDKANLSELDEAIRSMYKWYASCAAVVLDSGTPLDIWCSRGWCLQEGAAAGLLCGISKDGSLATIQQLAIEQKQNLCTLDLHLYYRPGNAVEILTRMDARKTSRREDMAYALAGIFSIDLTLAYGEGSRSRTRLLEQLAIQKNDLSFLSFNTTNEEMLHNSLPTIDDRYHLIAKCTTSSAPVTVSYFGICFEVQVVKREDAKRLLQKLDVWSQFSFAKDRFSGVKELIKAAEQSEHQNLSSVEIAIVHDINSLVLVQVYGYDMQTGGGKPIKRCYRLQCCQIEENEFDRLLTWNAEKPRKSTTPSAEAKPEEDGKVLFTSEDDTKDVDNFERIWLCNKTDIAEVDSFDSRTTGRHVRKRQRIWYA